MRLWLFVVFVMSVSAGTWWSLGDRSNQDRTNIDGSLIVNEPTSNSKEDKAPAIKTSEPVEDVVQRGENLSTEPTDTALGLKPVREESADTPFALVEHESQKITAADQNEPATASSSEGANTSAQQQAIQGEQRSGNPGEVPDSYPVTEAGKYFVRKEERKPGNLGGPPPLNFPGGPSDPDREQNQELQPPNAPGQ